MNNEKRAKSREQRAKSKESLCSKLYALRSMLYAQRGLALIAVMWIVTILTVLATEFIYSMQLEIRIARNWSDQVSAFYAAKGGLETAISTIRDDEVEYDSLDEDWAQELIGELNNSSYETAVIDESAKINVNTASEDTLTKAIAYCMESANEDKSEEEITAEAQTLAAAIIESRPYRTVAEIAKVTDMTPELLYGKSAQTTETGKITTDKEDEEQQQLIALADITTVYSADKNVASDGTKRVNINTANRDQIQQGINPEGQTVITQQEAQTIVDYRNAQGGGQSGQSNQPNQTNQPGQQTGQ